MNVKLISITKGSGDLSHLTAEELMAHAARVSNPANQMNTETAPRLLGYCVKNKHWSVFETVSACMEIKTSRGIAAQILRHRSFSFQEFSQRYAAAQDQVIYPARRQDTKNRQNSIDDMDTEDKRWFDSVQDKVWQTSMGFYKEALDRGVAKEQARFLLPLGTATTLYMVGTARSWIHYIDLRTAPGTQKEHRDIALECKEIFSKEFPNVAQALWGQEKV